MSSHEIASELLSIREQMEMLLSEAERLIRQVDDRGVQARAESYWIPHIKAAFGGHGYSSMCSMEDTIEELENEDIDDDPFESMPDEI